MAVGVFVNAEIEKRRTMISEKKSEIYIGFAEQGTPQGQQGFCGPRCL
jgi:hypothetical protein